MEDKHIIYKDQILPLIAQIYVIAEQNEIPFTTVFQTSNDGNEQTHFVPTYANKEMKQNAQWWLQGTEQDKYLMRELKNVSIHAVSVDTEGNGIGYVTEIQHEDEKNI